VASASRERVAQQHVRLGPGLLRLDVVGLLEIDGVDLLERHELEHVDDAVRRQRQIGEVLVGQHDHLAARQFVALRDVAVRDLFAVHLADALVANAAAVARVHLVEGNVTLLRRRIQLHGDRDQAEADRALPDAAHAVLPV
jgi:hypothetical protein